MKPQGWDLAAWGFALYVGGSFFSVLIPGIALLSTVGLILFLIGLYQVGQALGRPQVFTDQLIGRATLWLGFFFTGGTLTLGTVRHLEQGGHPLGSVLAGILVFWLFSIVAGWFIRRSFKALAEASRRPLFSLAGELIFWGAVAGIVLVGYLAVLAGEVAALIAFFQGPAET